MSSDRKPSRPLTYHPQLAQLVKTVPRGDDWLHEIKYDGYRIGCLIDRGTVRLESRNGRDFTAAFPEIVNAARRLPVDRAVIDGEAAILLPDGRTSFQALQNVFSGGLRAGLVYFAFDVLHLDGADLTGLPLDQRKDCLLDLLRRAGGTTTNERRRGSSRASGLALAAATRAGDDAPGARIRYSEHIVGHGEAVWREACRLRLEGIVSKRRTAPSRPGPSADWVKTKCLSRQELVIGGYTDPEGSRAGIGALVVGFYDGGRLVFAGKVGTGFTERVAAALRQRLDALGQDHCPFDPQPPGTLGRRAHWVRPLLVAEVAFAEWTSDGKVRHPSFQGLHEDRDPHTVTRDEPCARQTASPAPPSRSTAPPAGRTGTAEIRGVRITHPGRLLYPDVGLSKLDLARYYDSIGEWIVPHVQGRPLTIVRCPKGLDRGCFYMKHSQVRTPAPLRRVAIPGRANAGEYLVADTIEAVIGLVQMDVLEIHTWNSTAAHVERPDRLVLDLDPGAQVGWPAVVEAARLLRAALGAFDLEGYVKTTGGSGLHIVVPLAAVHEWSDCLAFARGLASRLVGLDPSRFTTSFAKAARTGKILIDYLRNGRTATSVAAYSSRARPGAPVSVPLAWRELAPGRGPDVFTVHTVSGRLARLRTDPWQGYWASRQRISRAALKAMAAR